MIAFIDDRRAVHGVEPICRHLLAAPSTAHAPVAARRDPSKRSARSKRDDAPRAEVARVRAENFGGYGARKVWRQLRREGCGVARCTVERPTRVVGSQGAVRGEAVKTAVPGPARPRPKNKAHRQRPAPAPDRSRVRDFRYVATRRGFARVAFVVGAHARRIAGWRVSGSPAAGFVLDALEPAAHERRPARPSSPVHRSERKSQRLSVKHAERLAEVGVEPSVGGAGDSYGDALAEAVIGLFKAELVRRHGPWRSLKAVEPATLERVGRFNRRRPLEPVGNTPPAQAEAARPARMDATSEAA